MADLSGVRGENSRPVLQDNNVQSEASSFNTLSHGLSTKMPFEIVTRTSNYVDDKLRSCGKRVITSYGGMVGKH
jgi:hypothetical protein